MRAKKHFISPLAFLIIVTVLARLAFASTEARKIPSEQLSRAVFGTEAGSIARSLVQEKGFSSPYERESGPTAILPPVYPLLVATVFKISGIQSAASFYVLVALNIAFAAFTCIPIYKVGLRLGNLPVATIATGLWALFPNGIFIPFEWIWETSLSALLAATLLWATLHIAGSRAFKDWILYGLLSGLSLVTNPALVAAWPVLLIWLALQQKARAPGDRIGPGLALGVALLCCIPWTVRNFEVFHRFIPLRSGFAFELYIGNNENYLSPRLYPPRISYERELVRYLRLGEVRFMDEEKQKASAFIRAHPLLVARLTLNRAIQFWTGLTDPLDAWRSHPAATDRLIVLGNLLAPVGAAAGAIILVARRHPLAVPLLASPVAYPVIYYLTHASLRYRHALDPNIFLLIAVALASAGSAFRGAPRTAQARR